MRRLVLASTDESLRDRLSVSLDGLAQVTASSPDLRRVAQAVAHTKPHLLLVDLDPHTGVTSQVQTVIDSIRAIDPRVEVVVIGDAADPKVVLQAVRAGSSDFLGRDDEPSAWRAHIAARMENLQAERAQPGRFTLVLNGRPGGGENLFAVNLALLLSRQAGEGLLIDCALPSSEAGAALDLRPTYTVPDAVRDLQRLDRTFLLSTLAQHQATGLHLLPLVGEGLGDDGLSSDDLLAAVSTVRPLFRETVLNAGALRHSGLIAALSRPANEVLLVCPQTFTALRDCRRLLEAFGPEDEIHRRCVLVIDEYTSAIGLSEEQMLETLGLERAHRLPAARADLINGLNIGRPLVLDAPRAPYALALEAIARGEAPAPARAGPLEAVMERLRAAGGRR